jgi:nitrile hydratase subunit beta
MNGIHDLGGMQDIGPIVREENEPVFHEEWERRAFAVLMATFGGGLYNLDEIRHGIERMSPAEYLSSTYYEHWMHGVETVLIEKGVITRKELDAKLAQLAKGGA